MAARALHAVHRVLHFSLCLLHMDVHRDAELVADRLGLDDVLLWHRVGRVGTHGVANQFVLSDVLLQELSVLRETLFRPRSPARWEAKDARSVGRTDANGNRSLHSVSHCEVHVVVAGRATADHLSTSKLRSLT